VSANNIKKEVRKMNLVPKNFYLDDVFDNFLSNREATGLKCDIYEKDGLCHIEMDAPGFKKEDIAIEVEDGYIKITASKKSSVDEEKKNYIRRERYASEYKRQFYVGNVDSDKVKAKFEEGSLKIELPIEEEPKNKKLIEIK